jgi:GntR family transcriptional regulator / MocR family aminotransferase
MGHTIRPIVSGGRRTSTWFAMFQRQAGSTHSLRDRICTAIRTAIQSGSVRAGARLPASRVLAADLRVSRITAEAAYAQLESEGYVRRRVGDGTFVHIDVGPGSGVGSSRSEPPPAGRRPSWSRRGAQIVRGGGCIDPSGAAAFSAGFPDLAAFPVETWRRLTARRIRRDGAALMGYGDPRGEPALRAAIARYLAQARGLRCTMEDVIVLTSSQQALHLAATMLTDPGDIAWIEDPGYRGARTALAAMGARLRPVPVDRDGLIAPTSGRDPPPRLIYTTPSHQYPTGVTLSLARRLALLDGAQRGGTYIIEDDYDSEFQYDSRPVPAMQGLDGGGHVLYVGTFSKVLFPALRLAYLVVPPALVSGFVAARTTYDGHPARLSQLVTADFIEEGHFAAHVRRMRRLYHHRRDLLLSEIDERLPWCRPFGTAAGLQLSVSLPEGRESALTQAAARAGVITPGVAGLFVSGPRFDGWLLGFASLRDDEIVEGVRRLATLRVRSGPRRRRERKLSAGAGASDG